MRTLLSFLVGGLSLLGTADVRAACLGDCSGDGAVTVNELVLGVNIAFGSAALDPMCARSMPTATARSRSTSSIGAVNSALNGCARGNFAGD